MNSTTQLSMWPIEDIVPYVRNARQHSAEQILNLRSSLREFGFVAPLLIDAEGRAAYTPWGQRDMATLAFHLPPLPVGASAWIRRFETSGDLLIRRYTSHHRQGTRHQTNHRTGETDQD